MHALLAGLLAVPSFLPAVAAWTVGETVKTTSGTLKGQPSAWQPTVSEYLGVPFAQPPVGPLRWEKPVAYNSPKAIDATKYSPSCPANTPSFDNAPKVDTAPGVILSSLGQRGVTYDEDCLTLNVWTQPQTGEKAKAVLVWIYGGGFALGATEVASYNGARLAAEQDVIVVSMNYRLNILGFPGSPHVSDQNLGLLDQRLAIEWIRDNIAAFGGDPKRITLFGESAGGASVDMYAYAWTADPIVNAFIAQSGTSSMGGMLGGAGNSTQRWYTLAAKLGCTDAATSTACMKGKPWRTVMEAIRPTGAAANFGGMGDYGPIPDGRVVMNDYGARSAAGKFIKRPLLVGNNANEVALFLYIANQKANLANPLLKLASAGFSCPSGDAAAARMAQGVKAWRYLYAGEYPNQALAPGGGAWHGSEIGQVFGSTEFQQKFYQSKANVSAASFIPDTPAQQKIIKTMMSAWAGFAKDPENALAKAGWPMYDAAKASVVQLGGSNVGDVKFVSPRGLDIGCSLMSSFTNAGAAGGSGGLSSLAALLGTSGAQLPKGAAAPKPKAATPAAPKGMVKRAVRFEV